LSVEQPHLTKAQKIRSVSGTYELENLTDKPTDGLFEGKLVIDKTYGYAVHGCGLCCPGEYDDRNIVQDPLNLSVGGSSTNPQTVWGIDACNNTKKQLPASGWNTGDHNVATVDSSGNVTAKGAGSTTDSANITNHTTDDRGYCAYLSAPTIGTVNVTQPDHLAVVIDNEGYPQCSQTQEPIYLRQMQMQAVDSNKNPVPQDVYIQEAQSPPNPTNSCPSGGSPVPSSCALTGNVGGVGQFLDSMTVNKNLCVAKGSVPAGCGFSVTSTWSACSSSGTNNLWVSPRVTHSDSVTVDGKSSQWIKGTQCTSSGCS